MSVHISDLMRTELISPSLKAGEKHELFREMTLPLVKAGILNAAQHEALHLAVCEREDMQCTALGHGLAVPHAYSPALPENLILLGRVPEGIDFGLEGCGSVRVIFLLTGPKRDNTEHLMILARIARMLKDARFVEALTEAPDAASLMDAVREVEARHS